MSHLTTYSCKALTPCKKSTLRKACADLGLGINFDVKEVRNSWVNTRVDAAFTRNGETLSVGIRFNDKKKGASIEGDFFCTGLDQDKFSHDLAQTYKKHDTIDQCRAQGWNVNEKDIYVDEKTDEVVITASRMVG